MPVVIATGPVFPWLETASIRPVFNKIFPVDPTPETILPERRDTVPVAYVLEFDLCALKFHPLQTLAPPEVKSPVTSPEITLIAPEFEVVWVLVFI
jgi:hypothetical protein